VWWGSLIDKIEAASSALLSRLGRPVSPITGNFSGLLLPRQPCTDNWQLAQLGWPLQARLGRRRWLTTSLHHLRLRLHLPLRMCPRLRTSKNIMKRLKQAAPRLGNPQTSPANVQDLTFRTPKLPATNTATQDTQAIRLRLWEAVRLHRWNRRQAQTHRKFKKIPPQVKGSLQALKKQRKADRAVQSSLHCESHPPRLRKMHLWRPLDIMKADRGSHC